MEKIINFLKVNYDRGSGYGYGDGSGYGYGDGSGDGSGDGNGSGLGLGYGDGSGDGSGSGYGDGSGHGSGDGSGSGYGSGSGNGSDYGLGLGYGIKRINKDIVYTIDGINTVIYMVKENVAKGAILNDDLSFTKCFIVKRNNLFAHGETIKKAMKSLEEKMFNNMDIEERIQKFLEEFELNKKYPAMKFYDWHNRLTGSCEMGRKSFAHNHGIDLENDEFTVVEFIDITKNDYGSSVIQKLEEYVCELSN